MFDIGPYLITRELFKNTNNALTPSRLSVHELLLLHKRTISDISYKKKTQYFYCKLQDIMHSISIILWVNYVSCDVLSTSIIEEKNLVK